MHGKKSNFIVFLFLLLLNSCRYVIVFQNNYCLSLMPITIIQSRKMNKRSLNKYRVQKILTFLQMLKRPLTAQYQSSTVNVICSINHVQLDYFWPLSVAVSGRVIFVPTPSLCGKSLCTSAELMENWFLTPFVTSKRISLDKKAQYLSFFTSLYPIIIRLWASGFVSGS